MLFTSWDSVTRILIVGIGAYASLVLLLRISGNRTLSKMNSFDFVVTVALGSTLASGILQKSVALFDTIAAFALLIGLQYAVTWSSVRSKRFDAIIKAEPKLVYSKGSFLKNAMLSARVTEDEIYSATREQGFNSLDQVENVILETNGTLAATGRIGIQKFLVPENKFGEPRPPANNSL